MMTLSATDVLQKSLQQMYVSVFVIVQDLCTSSRLSLSSSGNLQVQAHIVNVKYLTININKIKGYCLMQ
jgi:hypothetical protein